MVPEPSLPQFGRQVVQILSADDVLVHSTSETVSARQGETAEAFLRRLATEGGVKREDQVELAYKAGAPPNAVVKRASR